MAREVEADGRRSARVYGKRSPGDEYRTTDLLWGDACGCSWYFVRREPLETVGGFDPSLRSAEECDLAIRLSFHTRLFAWRAPQLLRRVHADNLTDDVALNARSWIAVVEKLQRDQPEFAQRHPWTIRRTLAKERMRWARHLLTHAGDDRDAVAVARRELLRSLRGYPFARAISYLGWAWIAPRCYRKFRQRELRLRRRR